MINSIELYDIKDHLADVKEIKSLELFERADLVASYFTLEHVKDVRNFLNNAARILKTGGFLILEVPNIEEYIHNADGFACPEHLNHFSPHSLERFCNEAGLTMVDFSIRLNSRACGFAAVFCKKVELESNQSIRLTSKEYLDVGAMYFSNLERVLTKKIGRAHV